MKKKPIILGIIILIIELYTLSLISSVFNLSKTIIEGVVSFLIMATSCVIILLIIKKLSKNNKRIVKISFWILLIFWILNVIFYIEDYLM